MASHCPCTSVLAASTAAKRVHPPPAHLSFAPQILGQPWARGLFPLIIDCFWAALWLACAAVLSKELSDYKKVGAG